MTSIMRRTARGAAAGLGALAIVAGAAACGALTGGDDAPASEEQPAADDAPAEEDAPAEDETTDEDAAEEEAADADSDDGGDDAAAAIDEAGLTAAGDRFLEFIHVLDDGDAEAACAFVIDPTTGDPVSGATLTQCGETLAPQMETLEPGTMDIIERSMIETADKGDGAVGITMADSAFPYPMKQGSDGEWYVDVAP